MDKTTRKIEKILSEIEKNIQDSDSENKKSVTQIADIFLKNGSNNYKLNNINDGEDNKNFVFDMRELSSRKEANNQLYETNYYHNILSQRRFIGKLIVFIKRVIRKFLRFLIEPIVKEQNEFNASITASINALYNNEIVTQEFIAKANTLINDIENNNVKYQDLSNRLQRVENEISNIVSELEKHDLKDNIKELNNVKLRVEEIKDNYSKEIKDMREQCEKSFETVNESISIEFLKWNKELNVLDGKLDNSELKFFRAFKEYQNENLNENTISYKELNNKKEVVQDINNRDTYTAIDYFNFENYFRGSRKEIKNALEIYADYFTDKGQIIELGSGRGEFLELMGEKDIDIVGIDAYKEFVDYCKIKGFNSVNDDAIAYVSRLKDESIGGIFAAQLIEHLKTDQIIQLCNDAYKKLIPGSYLIFETPNPTSLAIYTNAFYVDPSHNKPVHPRTIEYFLKQAGFSDISIIFTEHSKSKYRLPLLNGESISNLNEFNDGINCITDILFGSQDYAIIAKK